MDRVVAEATGLSRTRVQALIRAGRVTVGDRVVGRVSEVVTAGATILVEEPERAEPTLVPADIPLTFLYEDEDCLVVDKPAGLVSHPAPGHSTDTLINALLHHRPGVAGVGDERKPGLVHRLDRDTSGCLLVAKNDAAHRALGAQFAGRTVGKTYWALSWGHLPAETGVFDKPLGRADTDRQMMSSRTRRGRPAVTHYRVLERYLVADWVELGLETGRTHQIRVHLSEAGHPVIGDTRYGGGPSRARGFHGPQLPLARAAAALTVRQALHARALAFDQPTTGARVTVEAPWPADLERVRAGLRAQLR